MQAQVDKPKQIPVEPRHILPLFRLALSAFHVTNHAMRHHQGPDSLHNGEGGGKLQKNGSQNVDEGVSWAVRILVVLANVDDVDGDVGEDPDEEEDEPDHGLRVDRDRFQRDDDSDDDCRN